MVIAHAGAITFRLTVPGRAAHASRRREGVSALDNLYMLLRALEADETAPERRGDRPAHDGPRPAVPDDRRQGRRGGLGVDGHRPGRGRGALRRPARPDAGATRRRTCGVAIDAACAADPFLRDHPATVEITGGRFSSARVPADHPLPVGLAAVAEAVTGRRPGLIGEPYGADMRLLVNEGATPTVIFGPGDVRIAHSADERVPLDEVADCARVLAAWAGRLPSGWGLGHGGGAGSRGVGGRVET